MLDDTWLEPYKIQHQLGKGIYQLPIEKGKVLKKNVNINGLQLFKRRRRESDIDSHAEPPQERRASCDYQ